MSTGSLLN